jgi:hypothetical protein
VTAEVGERRRVLLDHANKVKHRFEVGILEAKTSGVSCGVQVVLDVSRAQVQDVCARRNCGVEDATKLVAPGE